MGPRGCGSHQTNKHLHPYGLDSAQDRPESGGEWPIEKHIGHLSFRCVILTLLAVALVLLIPVDLGWRTKGLPGNEMWRY